MFYIIFLFSYVCFCADDVAFVTETGEPISWERIKALAVTAAKVPPASEHLTLLSIIAQQKQSSRDKKILIQLREECKTKETHAIQCGASYGEIQQYLAPLMEEITLKEKNLKAEQSRIQSIHTELLLKNFRLQNWKRLHEIHELNGDNLEDRLNAAAAELEMLRNMPKQYFAIKNYEEKKRITAMDLELFREIPQNNTLHNLHERKQSLHAEFQSLQVQLDGLVQELKQAHATLSDESAKTSLALTNLDTTLDEELARLTPLATPTKANSSPVHSQDLTIQHSAPLRPQAPTRNCDQDTLSLESTISLTSQETSRTPSPTPEENPYAQAAHTIAGKTGSYSFKNLHIDEAWPTQTKKTSPPMQKKRCIIS